MQYILRGVRETLRGLRKLAVMTQWVWDDQAVIGGIKWTEKGLKVCETALEVIVKVASLDPKLAKKIRRK